MRIKRKYLLALRSIAGRITITIVITIAIILRGWSYHTLPLPPPRPRRQTAIRNHRLLTQGSHATSPYHRRYYGYHSAPPHHRRNLHPMRALPVGGSAPVVSHSGFVGPSAMHVGGMGAVHAGHAGHAVHAVHTVHIGHGGR
ncbi:hypothetical protein F4810DRAFT_705836 [Camillea tinctor]|nr:hypothetical protein F4810DRAFT_705836 [Camillea tinctor]